jgi:hypothetical protein
MTRLLTKLIFIINTKPKKQLIRTIIIKIQILYFPLNIYTGAIVGEGSSPLYINRSLTL